MDLQLSSPLVFFIFLISLLVLFRKWRKSRKGAATDMLTPLPPGPKRLPIIGNLHQMVGALPHHSLAKLAKKHGPLMYLQLGQMPLVVVSSPDIAKEILKNHELSFAERSGVMAHEVLMYEDSSFIFSPYGEYWRQMRKIIVLELLSTKRVQSFRSIREHETWNMIKSISISSSAGKPVNLSKSMMSLIHDVTSSSAFGSRCEYREEFISFLKEVLTLTGGFELPDLFPSIGVLRHILLQRKAWVRLHNQMDRILDNIIDQHKRKLRNNEQTNDREDLVDVLLRLQRSNELKFVITLDVIKNMILELFSAGVETSSTTAEWVMSELIKNPRVMAKAQAEVRTMLKGKTRIKESDIQGLNYLKNIVKETLRLHPSLPLMPRNAREEHTIRGYRIPQKIRVVVNVSMLGRDPNYWSDPESFKPERFEESSIDFRGGSFEYIPFGSGRRICPGMNFALGSIELPLAQLLYHFDWEMADGKRTEELDMTEARGLTARRKTNLVLIPTTVVSFCDEE